MAEPSAQVRAVLAGGGLDRLVAWQGPVAIFSTEAGAGGGQPEHAKWPGSTRQGRNLTLTVQRTALVEPDAWPQVHFSSKR